MIYTLYCSLILTVLFTLTFYSQLNSVGRLVLLVLLYLLASLIYLMFGFEFIGLAYIVVYCGAIAIIFLFVIMMISTDSSFRPQSLSTLIIQLLPTFILSSFILNYSFASSLAATYFYSQIAKLPFIATDILNLSVLLYVAYPTVLVIIAISLLLVLLGLIRQLVV